MRNDALPERLERKTVYESDYICLYTDKVKLPDGYVIEKYHQLHYPHEAVCVVIFNERDEILMIHERRYTVGRLEWEVPTGKIEEGETAEEAVRREALEETGCTLKDLRHLCSENPSHGMSDQVVQIFGARVATEAEIMDINEVAEKKWVSIDEAKHMLKHNETRDGISMLAILYAFEFYR